MVKKKRKSSGVAGVKAKVKTGIKTKVKSGVKAKEEIKKEVDGNADLPLVHLVVRTHDRPNYFKACIASINGQDYERRMIHVIADTPGSVKYANDALNEGLIDEVIVADPINYRNGFGDFGILLKRGFSRGNSDLNKHVYDLYLNKVIAGLDVGWVFIVDDDKELPDSGLLSRIVSKITGDDDLLVGQYKMKSRLLPEGDKWGVLPFTRAHIDMSCVVFNLKHRDIAVLDGHGAGDWRMCNNLAAKLNVVWMREPFVVTNNDGLFGKGER